MPEKTVNDIPRDVRPLFTKGNDALSRENWDYAIDLFSQVLAREPAVFDVRKALRRAQQGRVAGGTSFFKKMLSNAGSSPMMAKAQMALRNNPLEAMAAVEQVLNSDPNNAMAHRLAAEAAMALEWPRTAVLSLEVLSANNIKDKTLAIQFANALAAIGEVQRAEVVLAEFRQSMPNDPEINQALKNISAKRTMEEQGYNKLATGKGSYRDVLKDAEEAVQLEQEKRVQKTENVADRLIAEYESRLKAEPTNLKLIRQLADLYAQKKQFDVALKYFDQVKSSEMGNDPSLDSAIAATKVKKFDYEIEQLDKLAPDYADRVAQINAEKLTYQVAECQRRVEKFPTDLAIRFEMGVLYFHSGKISEAQKEFQKAQSNPNKRIAALNYLAQCFAKRKIYDLAASTLEDAIKEKLVFDDEKKELLYNLGSVFESMEKKAEAIEQFKAIYKVDSSYRDVEAKVDKYYGGGE